MSKTLFYAWKCSAYVGFLKIMALDLKKWFLHRELFQLYFGLKLYIMKEKQDNDLQGACMAK